MPRTSTARLEEKCERLTKRWIHDKTLESSQEKDLERFVEHMEDEGFNPRTRYACISVLLGFARQLKKPFKNATTEDVKEYLRKINKNGNSANSWNNAAMRIRKFYQWLYGMKGKEYPEQVSWIKYRSGKKQLPIDHFLTKEEFYQFVNSTDNSRDRALIMVSWDSGGRISEILDLRIKNVEFDQYGAVLILNGKTGMRRVRLIESAPDLQTWINQHPFKDNPDAPIWQSTLSRDSEGKMIPEGIALNSVYWLFDKYKKKSGLKKDIHPHLLRHMKATQLASVLSEQELKVMFGWAPDSRMASVYTHLSGEDLDKKLLKVSGIKIKGEEKSLKHGLRLCPRCKYKNSPLSKFCSQCGLALDLKTAMTLEKVSGGIDKYLTTVLEDKEVKTLLLSKLKTIAASEEI